ncbi:hypothetical protein SDRG_03095 [Saprolegnia diclina VS20]|uniref:Anaphase-promoting complex subunit 4 WD40 domain-containing protein n=1 Tax=Saprolegnia diclina (strain VS20) TaxID=1156394 RepID=T0QYA3_SAPDV|nr:hypothetical protein SDRG_03095 [Saprolegnia diclina VS20]EQC39666.1 hypothetical protein SDRG_03095 [Saprolegnia diclina VS20]|eukprot:XP_008606938.1 hypothetical protein SDRG_03095 [Saprolegnia diclina VS20]
MTNIESVLQARERQQLRPRRLSTPVAYTNELLGGFAPHVTSPMRHLQSHAALVKRLVCDSALDGHSGCVNRLSWNRDGSLLASGSDDTNVVLWDFHRRKARHTIATGHSMNIFGVCFVPGTNDHVVASAGMDCEVRLHHAPFRPQGSELLASHRGRVKDLAASHLVPHVFWSGGEDGVVRQFDIRALGNRDDARNTLINLGRPRLDARRLRVMGLSVHPTDATKMAIACGDHYIRIFDQRMLRMNDEHASQPLQLLTPPHLHFDADLDSLTRYHIREAHGTSVQYSPDGNQILANYHNDHIYLFDVNERTAFEPLEPVWTHGMHLDAWAYDKPAPSEPLNDLLDLAEKCIEWSKPSAALEILRALRPPSWQDDTIVLRLWTTLARAYIGRAWRGDGFLALQYVLRCLQRTPTPTDDLRLIYIQALSASGRQRASRREAQRLLHIAPSLAEKLAPFLLKRRRPSVESSLADEDDEDDEDDDDDDDEDDDEDDDDQGDSDDQNDDEDDEDVDAETGSMDESDATEGGSSSSAPSSVRLSIESADGGAAPIDWGNCHLADATDVALHVLRRYIGYCNLHTDIKEATFFGDEHIVAGSDDGYAYIWDRATGCLANALKADEDIVNCVQGHPLQPVLATSGIENVVRLWSPVADVDVSATEDELDALVAANQQQMQQEATFHERHRHAARVTRIMENPNLLRMLLTGQPTEGASGAIPQCAQS